jgi:glyoxylase-like metal-dependent hydrolase (beta-lactamase superfamily II)
MKRLLKITALVIGLVVLVAVVLIVPAFVGRRAIVDGFEINGIRIVKDGIVSVAVVPIGSGEVALIDAGNDKSGKAILTELSRRQLSPDAVTAILLTHGHPDHTAGIALFPKAQVMALDPEVALVEGRAKAHGPLPRLFPASPTGMKVTRALKDSETVTLGQAPIQVFAVPGHTAGSAAYLVNGILFLGDAADVASDGKIEGSPWVFSDSQAEDRASLVRLDQRLIAEGTSVKAIACAHSGALVEGLAPLTAFAQQNH